MWQWEKYQVIGDKLEKCLEKEMIAFYLKGKNCRAKKQFLRSVERKVAMNISHKESLIKDMISVCSLSSDELSGASRMEFIDKVISWHYTD